MPFSCSPTPSPKAALSRGQRTDDQSVRASDHLVWPLHLSSALGADASASPLPGLRPGVSAYPCPGTTDPTAPRPEGPRRPLLSCPLHGHDSLHDVKTSRGPHRPVGRARRSRLSGQLQGTAAPSPRSHPRLLVGLGRFERPTSRLSGVRSNQLSYRPGFRGQRQSQRSDRQPAATNLLSDLCLCPLEGMRRRRPGSDWRSRRGAEPRGRSRRSRHGLLPGEPGSP